MEGIKMQGWELIKEFYKPDENGHVKKYTHICGIVDNEKDRDDWLHQMTPYNTYSSRYGYHEIKEL
jgi:hypothetical protein